MTRHGAIAALLWAIAWTAPAAENPTSAARELARKTAQFAGRAEVSATYRNISTLGAEDFLQFRQSFEAGVRESGLRAGEAGSGLALQVTVSENPTDFLAVVEARRGDERQVWIASWPKSGGGIKAGGLQLQKTELWRQPEAILDAAVVPGGWLALTASKVTMLARREEHSEPSQSAPIASSRPWPRDLRGKLRINGSSFQAFLPGVNCVGSIEPALTIECKAADLPWLIESGSRLLLYASFAADRNVFDGRVVTQTGARKNVPPFYTAAAADDEGRAGWIFALTDGRAQIADASFEPVDTIAAWGSDMAGVSAPCGGGSVILATKPGESESDALQAYRVSGRSATPLGAALTFAGPVTALWTSAPGTGAVAVAREGGDYVAYSITVNCGS